MVKRVILNRLIKTWGRGKSVLLLGPRQTGKTTLSGEFSFDLTLNFLSNRIRQTYERNPDLIFKEVAAVKKRGVVRVLVDEVQKVPQIMDPIQNLIDNKKAQFFKKDFFWDKISTSSTPNQQCNSLSFLPTQSSQAAIGGLHAALQPRQLLTHYHLINNQPHGLYRLYPVRFSRKIWHHQPHQTTV